MPTPIPLKQLDADVASSSSTVADNTIVRGDGGARGIQQSGVTINDTDQMASIETATFNAVHSYGNLGATPTFDLNLGQKQAGTISANITAISFTAPPGPGNFILVLTQNGTGGFTVPATAWPATARTPGGTAPVVSTGANQVSLISVYYDGTNYFLGWHPDQAWAEP